MTEYEWEQIQLLYGFKLAQDQQGSTCPDALTPRQLAIMQRPFLKTAPDRTAASRSQRQFLSRLEEAINFDQLHSLSRTRLVPITEVRTVENRLAPRSAWQISGGWGSGSHERPPLVRKTVKTGEREEEYKVVERAAFREWLSARGEPPSSHIAAWLDEARPAMATKEAGPMKRDVFLNLLTRIEEAWIASGRAAIDRKNWPGKSKELCSLAGRLLPESFGEMKSDSFYRNYPKKEGVCFSATSGVPAIYAELFPEDGATEGPRSAA